MRNVTAVLNVAPPPPPPPEDTVTLTITRTDAEYLLKLTGSQLKRCSSDVWHGDDIYHALTRIGIRLPAALTGLRPAKHPTNNGAWWFSQ